MLIGFEIKIINDDTTHILEANNKTSEPNKHNVIDTYQNKNADLVINKITVPIQVLLA